MTSYKLNPRNVNNHRSQYNMQGNIVFKVQARQNKEIQQCHTGVQVQEYQKVQVVSKYYIV